MENDELREMVRQVLREVLRDELALLAPPAIPSYRVLANRRQDLGLTQARVGRDLGVSTATVGSWDTGRLPMKSADRYAAYLGLRILVVEDAK